MEGVRFIGEEMRGGFS